MANPDRVMEILTEASEMPAAERAGYLQAACGGDPALRSEVESLLRAHDGAGRFLSEATVLAPPGGGETGPSGPSHAAADERYGQMIGRYKLLEVIGEGGFGTVWMAEQREPIKRRVALKIIKLGMDTRQVIARFEAERQALAMMDHPGIAKVLDAGSTQTGRPYFVMEYIKGEPVLDYCRRERLGVAQRLELFVHICQALQHAHQKGIIHRDIKPANVLVTMHDGVPVPKVIDFGIAKATSAELTQRTLFTEHRQFIGTPAYMSPEQAEMSGLDIDTRSDIYSLGVLLYELLTGTTPFAAEQLLSKGFAEMVRIIREVEPPKPSTRLFTLQAAAARPTARPAGAAGEPGPSVAALQSDLDWIVMKCLEKDRTRRYESAGSLAADVRRHLSDEPVTAGAPTAGYRLQKFVRRHRLAVSAAGGLAVVLLLGVAGTSIGLVGALRERDRANDAAADATASAQAEARARASAEASEAKARAEAQRAEAARTSEARARARAETITDFVTRALRSADAQNLGEVEGAGQSMTVLAAMDNAVREINSGRFRDDPETEARLLETIAQVLRNNGRVEAAEPLVVRSLALVRGLHPDVHPDLASSIEHLAHIEAQMGRLSLAESLFVEAVEMRRRLHTPGDAALAGVVQAFGMLRLDQGRLEDARRLCDEALELSRGLHSGDHTEVAICMNNLALVRRAAGDLAEAESLFEQALAMHRRLHPGDHPEVAAGLNNLATVQVDLSRFAEAEALLVDAVEMRQRLYAGDHPATATSLANLSSVRLELGRLEPAEVAAVQAVQMSERLFKGDHPAVASALASLATVRKEQGNVSEAESLFVRALEMARRTGDAEGLATAFMLNNLGVLRQRAGRASEAEAPLTEALRIRERLLPAEHPLIVASLRNLATVLHDLGRPGEAAALSHRADESAGNVQSGGRGAADDRRAVAAVELWRQRALDKSIPLFEAVLQDQRRVLGPESAAAQVTAANLGVNYKDAGRLADALPMLERAADQARSTPELRFVLPHLLDAYADSAGSSSPSAALTAKATALADVTVADLRNQFAPRSPQLAGQLLQVAGSLLRLGAFVQAEPLAREVLEIRSAGQPDHWGTFNAQAMLGAALLGQGKLQEAEPLLTSGYQGMRSRRDSMPPHAVERLREAAGRLGDLARAKGDPAAAARWKAEADALPTPGEPTAPPGR